MIRQRWRFAATIATAIFMALSWAAPSAAQGEIDLLASYVGSWSGEGVMSGGGGDPEPFRCRLSVEKGNAAKIVYQGRCTLVNMNLSVGGTIAFNAAGKRYEAAMSSNVGFKGTAIGRKRGNTISFDLSEQQTDRGGNAVRIGSRIILIGDSITVNFEVEFNNSGQVATASVPFSR